MNRNVWFGAGLFVAGAVAGAAVAALTTPYSGRRMRRKVQHTFEEGAGRVKEAAGRFKEQCGEVLHQGGRLASEAEKMFARAIH